MCDNSKILYTATYHIHKNDLYEEEILYDDDADPGPAGPNPPTSIINNGYLEFKVHNQNDKITRQTHEYFCCPINKVKQVSITAVLNILEDSTGYTSRIGVFDDHNDKTANHDVGGNGYFFALIDGVLNIGIRNGTIDNGTDTLISQTNFNANTFPEYDSNQIYIYYIEYSSIGEVYFYINTGNGIMLLHYYKDPDTINLQITRPNLPIRYEIFKTGVQGNNGEMRIYTAQVCCTNKFHHCDKPYSCSGMVHGRGKLFTIPRLVCRGYVNLKSHTHSNIKHSSHHKHSHKKPNGTGTRSGCMFVYHTPHTRYGHICAHCDHTGSTRCRHSSHTGHSSSKKTTFKSSKCTKTNCMYHHHKQIFKQCAEYIPLFSIRLKAGCNRLCLQKFSLIAHLKKEYKGFILSVIKNPIFTGIVPHCWIDVPGSCIEYDDQADHLCQTEINILYQKWVLIETYGFIKIDFNFVDNIIENYLNINSNIAGEPNIYTFVGQRIDDVKPDVLLSLEWYE